MAIAGLNYTAIDFETANSTQGSVCAVGMIKVRDGEVWDTKSSLVKPPDGGYFNPFNIKIHGIRPTDVVRSPTWLELWPTVQEFVGDDALVAHNAAFDRSVWRGACELSAIEHPVPPFYCTMRLARRVLALPSARLPLVASALGIPPFSHHDATADALACAQIGIELAGREGFLRVEDFGTLVGGTKQSRRRR